MAGETDKNVETVGEKSAIVAAGEEKPKDEKKSKEGSKKKGFFAWLWNGLFGSRNNNFEQRLERISKEEKIVINRMRRRAQSWGSAKRNIILFAILLEVRIYLGHIKLCFGHVFV